MKCSKCGGKTRVVSVRTDPKQAIHRHRKCKDCGHTFYTKECEVELGCEFHRADNLYKNALRNKTT